MSLPIKAFIMGIVEGLTEFLPISSTGHMIIVGEFIDFKGGVFFTTFEVVIQLGAILAVVYYYRHKIASSLKHLRPGEGGFELWSKILISFLPAAAIAFILHDFIYERLFSSLTVALALVIGGIMMILAENNSGKGRVAQMEKATYKQAFLIGVYQCMALIPGMSRSASTIMGGMISGLSVKAAAEFSFFLAMPTMVAASSYSLLKGFSGLTSQQWQAIGIGFVVSFVVALLAVDKFLSYLQRHALKSFAYYRIIVGFVLLLMVAGGVIK